MFAVWDNTFYVLFALDYILQNVVLKRKNDVQTFKSPEKIVKKYRQKNLQDPCRATDYPVECVQYIKMFYNVHVEVVYMLYVTNSVFIFVHTG